MLQRREVLGALGAVAVSVVAGCSSSGVSSGSGSAASKSGGPLKAGDAAPKITLRLHDDKQVDLASTGNKLVLVYFYPKDETKGCTIEAEGIRDAWDKFRAAGIDVYGVSTQDAASHQAFIEKHDLPFPLVVDGEAVAQAFGVPLSNGMAARQSFLLRNGKVIASWLDVDPAEHASSVLAAATKA